MIKKGLSKALLLLAISMVYITFSCNNTKITDDAPIIGKADLKLESDLLTPEVLWSFGRLNDVQVAPD